MSIDRKSSCISSETPATDKDAKHDSKFLSINEFSFIEVHVQREARRMLTKYESKRDTIEIPIVPTTMGAVMRVLVSQPLRKIKTIKITQ